MKTHMKQFIGFGMVGLINTIFNYWIYIALVFGGVSPSISNGIGYLVTSVIGYLMNRKVVFKDTESGHRETLIRYYLTYGTSLILTVMITYLWVNIFHLPIFLAPAGTLLITVPFNFILSKRWVFRPQKKYLISKFVEHTPFIYFAVLIFIPKLILLSSQYAYVFPGREDDLLLMKHAASLLDFDWLGSYDNILLAKGPFTGIYIAFLNVIGIPYLLGNQLLCFASALSIVYSLKKLIKNRYYGLVIFSVLLYNPASYQFQATRAYRDSFYSYFVLMFLAGMIGWYLNRASSRKSFRYMLLSAISFTAQWLSREDGFWLLPLAVAGGLAILLSIIFEKRIRNKRRKISYFVFPLVIFFGCMSMIAGMNKLYYNRFVVNDYTSWDFQSAYGALTRVTPNHWEPEVPVSTDMREKIYQVSPAFRELQPFLEEGSPMFQAFASPLPSGMRDYKGGWFFWALREAVNAAGHYADAKEAETYYIQLAKEVNQAIAEGKLPSNIGKRSSLSPPFHAEYIAPMIESGRKILNFAIHFDEVYSDPDPSVLPHEDVYRYGKILNSNMIQKNREGYGEYLSTKVERIKYRILNKIMRIYQKVIPVIFYLSVILFILTFVCMAIDRRFDMEVALVSSAVFLLVVLRVMILAFVDVSSFSTLNSIYMMSVWGILLVMILVIPYNFWIVFSDLLKKFQKTNKSS